MKTLHIMGVSLSWTTRIKALTVSKALLDLLALLDHRYSQILHLSLK